MHKMDNMSLFGTETPNWTPRASCPQPTVPSEARVVELFEYWKETFNKRNSTLLDEARRKKLHVALRNYSMEVCKKAIKGCSLSAWHTGQNPNNKKYTELSLIFRNAEKVEYFVEIYESNEESDEAMDEWLHND